MKVVHGRRGSPSELGSVDQYTGKVTVDSVVHTEKFRVNQVLFEPGARTFWHTHEGDQFLYVVAGQGRVGSASGEVIVVRAGDAIHFGNGEEHWHGAGSDSYMVHLAVTIPKTNWLRPVTENEYSHVADERSKL